MKKLKYKYKDIYIYISLYFNLIKFNEKKYIKTYKKFYN
jgi:hypothetical protein